MGGLWLGIKNNNRQYTSIQVFSNVLQDLTPRGGRFVTVLPRGRTEDLAFRQRLRTAHS